MLEDYRHTISADEIFLQTAVHHSKFKENLYKSAPNDIDASMRLIDWVRGTPYVFQISDSDELINSDCMFARKFDENIDKQIIEKLYETLRD